MAGALAGRTSAGAVRASDAERELAADALRRHFAAGRLTASELEERVARAYSARSRADLAAVLADLPSDRAVRAAIRFYRLQREALRYHAAAYVSVNGSLVAIWAATGEGQFWPGWVLAPGTAMIAWHSAGSRLLRRVLRLDRRGP